MAGNLQDRVDTIRLKARMLTQRYRQLKTAKAEADARIQELEEVVKDLQRQINNLNRRNEYLSVASTLFPDKESVEKGRAVLSELVREIDKCIAEITDE